LADFSTPNGFERFTVMFPPIVMETQTGSTNKSHFPDFLVLAAPLYWWKMINYTNTNGAL
jgi:hypothetical protein